MVKCIDCKHCVSDDIKYYCSETYEEIPAWALHLDECDCDGFKEILASSSVIRQVIGVRLPGCNF
jgi:hypothetical protein